MTDYTWTEQEIRRSYRPCSECGEPGHAGSICPGLTAADVVPEVGVTFDPEVIERIHNAATVAGVSMASMQQAMQRVIDAYAAGFELRPPVTPDAAERYRREALTTATGGMLCYHPREQVRRFPTGVTERLCPDCPAYSASPTGVPEALRPWVFEPYSPQPENPNAVRVRHLVHDLRSQVPLATGSDIPVTRPGETVAQRLHAAAQRARAGVW